VKSTQKRDFQPDPSELIFFGNIVDPVEVLILAKCYCFMATRFLRVDIQSCQKNCFFLGTNYLRKSNITSSFIELQSLFYAHFKANKWHLRLELRAYLA
jgi:hypothetical protein